MERMLRESTILLLLLLCLSVAGWSQTQLQRSHFTLQADQSKHIALPSSSLQALHISWANSEAPASLEYRIISASGKAGPWQSWSLHNEFNAEVSSMLLLDGKTTKVEVRQDGDAPLRLIAFSYAEQVRREGPLRFEPLFKGSTSCDCSSPAVLPRTAWCPDGNCPEDPSPLALTPRHLVIHHSGTIPSTSNYALVIRAIYDAHTEVNGWDDIGYNLIMAPDGTLYQGRGVEIQGAHFCGKNPGTLGICLLGN